MRTTLLLLVLLAGPVLAAQTVWVSQETLPDGQVVTRYSDRPVPGAKQIQLNTPSSSESSPAPSYGSPQRSPAPAAGPPYVTLAISSPADQESIVNTGGQVTVTVDIQPSLQIGHRLQLLLDGKVIEGSGTSFQLTDVPRGTHAVLAIVSSGTTRVQESAPVTFFVRQESVAQPPVGPALRPPPKPQPRAGNKMQTSQPTYAALNPVRTAPIDPATNRPVVTKPATAKPTTPGPRQGK